MTMEAQITALAQAIGADVKALLGGIIVDSGSNANGWWVRWGDGTQMCRSRRLTIPGGFAAGTFHIIGSTSAPFWTLPKPLLWDFDTPTMHVQAGNPQVQASLSGGNIQDINGQSWMHAASRLLLRNVGTQPTGTYTATAIAWGRWK